MNWTFVRSLTVAIMRGAKNFLFKVPKQGIHINTLKFLLRNGIRYGGNTIQFAKRFGNAVWESGDAIMYAADDVVGKVMYYRKGTELVIKAGSNLQKDLDLARQIAKAIDIQNIPFQVAVENMQGVTIMRFAPHTEEEKKKGSWLEEFTLFMQHQAEAAMFLPRGALGPPKPPEA